MNKKELFNYALGRLPHDRRVEDCGEASTEALRLRDAFPGALYAVMHSFPWGCFTEFSPVRAGSPVGGGVYFYPRFKGALRVIGAFSPQGEKIALVQSSNGYRLRSPVAVFSFVRDERDVEKFPEYLCEALVCELAARVCIPIMGDARRASTLRMEATEANMRAREVDANETSGGGFPPDFYARARE